jgi:hypothetical protein
VLNINQGIHYSPRAKTTGERETFFCRRLHGKIYILEVFVEGIHAH